MSKAVKQLVKEAKQAYAEKQLKVAEEKCHEVLKEDPKNYYGLLILGAIYKETNPEQAIKCLYKAIECTGDTSHAFQGLLKCVANNEMPELCKRYLQKVPSAYEKIHKELETCALVVKTRIECIEILKEEVNTNDEQRVYSAYKSLVEIYMNGTNIDRSWWAFFRQAFETVVGDSGIRNHNQVFIKYLKLLRNLKEFEPLLNSSIRMLELYPTEYIPMDMICWVNINKYQSQDLSVKEIIPKSIETYADAVLEMGGAHPSINALLSKSIHLIETENYVAARDYLKKAENVSNDDPLCRTLLADTHLKLHAFTLAEHYYTRSNLVNLKLLRSLVEQNTTTKAKEALEFIPKVEQQDDLNDEGRVKLNELYAKALLQTNCIDEANEKIQSLSVDAIRYNRVLIYKHLREGQYAKCLELLQSFEGETCEYFLQLGETYFHLERYPDALNAFLRATKLEAYNADCFYWLGKVYLQNEDTERARKCFEKSVFLNPQHEQSVTLLSVIYRQHSEWDTNAKLLQTAAQAIPNTACKWANLFLAFHHLSQNQFDDAINAFRAVLRMDTNNFTSWEGLADSYLKRGSYSSALKVYRKICELTDDNDYAQLQVANVLTIMRFHKDAIKVYESLLEKCPDYVAALKGIADAHLGIANYYLEQRLVGRSKAHAEQAVNYLIRAIQKRNNLICFWRLLGNCFDFIAALPIPQAFLSVPGALVNESDDTVSLHGDRLYEFASRFYCRAIKLSPSDLSLWYELALNYYRRALKYGTNETRKKYLDLAAEAAKHIVKGAPLKWKYWNLLGVISATEDLKNLALAQHCFIKALEIDKVAVVWTNLGVLYLSQNQLKLANMAFRQAQQSEPSYGNAWTGQALVAEIMDPNEALDLLCHSITLGYHDESAIQYAYFVCSLLSDAIDPKRIQYYTEHLNVISSALDSITWYCKANEPNVPSEALSFLGYLYYNQHNWRIAIRSFQLATEQIERSQIRDQMLCNLAYSLLKDQRPTEAVQAFGEVSNATFQSTIGLAQSRFKAKQYESSYADYERALEGLATNDRQKSLILVALSAMVYAFQGEADAKTVLFQCIGREDSPIEALLSACALGILHNDLQLSELVLKELNEYERDDLWCHHIAFLTSELYAKKGDKEKGLKYLYSQIHHFPDKPLLRKVLANFLLKNVKKDEKHSTAATRMVEGTITMQRSHSKREMSSMDEAKLLVLASEAMRCINPVQSKRLVQKAIHVNPLCKEAWAAKQLLCA